MSRAVIAETREGRKLAVVAGESRWRGRDEGLGGQLGLRETAL